MKEMKSEKYKGEIIYFFHGEKYGYNAKVIAVLKARGAGDHVIGIGETKNEAFKDAKINLIKHIL